MRCVGTVVRGIRTPIIKENDDLATIVVDSLMRASENEGFSFRDRDVVAITEAVVGISEGNYVTVDDIAEDEEGELSHYGICAAEDATDVNVDMICAAFPAEWKKFESEDAIKKAVESEAVEAGFVMKSPTDVTYVVNDLSMYDYLGDMFSQTLSECYKQQYLMDKGLTAEEIAESENFYVNVTEEVLGKDSGENYWYTYVLVFVVYFLIIFYGQMIATSVTTEKSNRAIHLKLL